MAADPFLFPMYYLLFKTVSDKWGHRHPMRTEIAINFFFSWISMMDTGIFLLNIIFIRYRVCCQNPQVINMLRVYITALPEAVRSRQRFLMFPVRWVWQTAGRAAPGYSSAPTSLAPCAFDTCLPGAGCFRKYRVPRRQHLQTGTVSAARFCCSSCHGLTDFTRRVFLPKAHHIGSLVRIAKSSLLSGGKLLLICVLYRKKKSLFFPTVT